MVISHSDEQAKLLLRLANVKSENDTAPRRVVSVTSLPANNTAARFSGGP